MEFDFYKVVAELKRRRPFFIFEVDMQLEMSWIIRELYPTAEVRLEYVPEFDSRMRIDILVILDGKWYPIELKYKTVKCAKVFRGVEFNMKNHGARDLGMYNYLRDIKRMEKVREALVSGPVVSAGADVAEASVFGAGYTMMITNDLKYLEKPGGDYSYADFSLYDGAVKTGKMSWGARSGDSTFAKYPPFTLVGTYPIHWQEYSKLDDTVSGTFMYLVHEVR